MNLLTVIFGSLSTGILSGHFLPFEIPLWVLILGSVLIFFLTTIAAIKGKGYWGFSVYVTCFLAGIICADPSKPQGFSPYLIKKFEEGNAVLKGRVISPSKETSFGESIVIEPCEIIFKNEVLREELKKINKLPEKIRIFIPAISPAQTEIMEGDTVFLKKLKMIQKKEFRNPDVHPVIIKNPIPSFSTAKGGILVHQNEGKGFFKTQRNRLSALLKKRLPQQVSGFVEAIVSGRGEAVNRKVADDFRNSGLAHLLAVSGLHLSLVALSISKIIERLISRIPFLVNRFPSMWISGFLSIPLVWLYAIFTSLKPPVLRASIMVTACQITFMLGRKSSLPSALSLAGIIILLIEPENIKTPSFLLSFSAVLGIFLFSKNISDLIKRSLLGKNYDLLMQYETKKYKLLFKQMLIRLADLLSVSAGATVATTPFSCFFFGKIPVVGIFANIIGVPLFSLSILPLNIIYSLVLLIFSHLPNILSSSVVFINKIFLKIVSLFGQSGTIEVEQLEGLAGSLVLIIGFFLLISRKFLHAILAFILSISLFFAPWAYASIRARIITSNKLVVIFADVGQGDAAFVRTPERKHILIDSGPPPGEDLSKFLKKWAPRGIDLFVITHGHRDHYGGAEGLLQSKMKVSELWINPQGIEEKDDPHYIELIEQFRRNGTKVKIGPKCGTYHQGVVRIDILSPCDEGGYDPLLDWNNNSIVLNIIYGTAGFLLTGDIEAEGESRLSPYKNRIKTTILKVPHHGSGRGSSNVITKWPGLKYAVISAGQNNKYGFPAKRVVEDFRRAGAKVFRVDSDGAWMFITDGKKIDIRDYKWNLHND